MFLLARASWFWSSSLVDPARRSRLRRSAIFGRSDGAALRAAFGVGQRFALPWGAFGAPRSSAGKGSRWILRLGLEVPCWVSMFWGWASRFWGWASKFWGWGSMFWGWVSGFRLRVRGSAAGVRGSGPKPTKPSPNEVWGSRFWPQNHEAQFKMTFQVAPGLLKHK